MDVHALMRGAPVAEPKQGTRTLLEGIKADNHPDLSDWLSARQAQIKRWPIDGLRREVTRLVHAGLLNEAIEVTQQWRAADTPSEEPWRTLMRICHLSGNRASALQVYRECQALIRKEFGSEPSQETQAPAAELSCQEAPLLSVRLNWWAVTKPGRG